MSGKVKLAIMVATVLLLLSLFAPAAQAKGENSASIRPASNQTLYRPKVSRTPNASEAHSFNAERILVKFKDKALPPAIDSVHAALGGVSVRQFKAVKNLHLVNLSKGLTVESAIASYKKNPDVLYAEPDYAVSALTVPNDPSLNLLWGLQNSGKDGGVAGADIGAAFAWDLQTGSKNVVVAVIDTGIDYNHQDLASNVWTNTSECTPNGMDDDGNGYIDDCHGINVVDRFSPPFDDYGHGSHVAGTIGAVGNNGIGVVGVNWNVSILSCKFLDGTGGGFISGAIECLDYVREMKRRGVNIIATSNSWGGPYYSEALYDAIAAHVGAGVLFIAAAGNSGHDMDAESVYPAGYFSPNIVSVAATDKTDTMAVFSNDGKRSVHLGAPGVDIVSTFPGNAYQKASGTSMAAPHVSGVAALLKAQDPSRDWKAIKNIILASGASLPTLANTVTGSRLSASRALTCTNATLLARLWPRPRAINAGVGEAIDLSVVHVNCAKPNGEVQVSIQPGGKTITLKDDGKGSDQVAGDGIYSARWTPSAEGIFAVNFPGQDVLSVQVALGNPRLFRPQAVYHEGFYGSAPAVADLNGDKKDDVIFIADANHLYVSYQNASGALDTPVSIYLGPPEFLPRSLAVGDVNNDGRADVVLACVDNIGGNGFIGVLLQTAEGGLGPMTRYPAPDAPVRVKIGDLNNDGLLDVAYVGEIKKAVGVFLQNRVGTFDGPFIHEVSWCGGAFGIGDVDDDGLNDIVAGGTGGDPEHGEYPIEVLRQKPGGTFGSPSYYTLRALPGTGTYRLVVGDVNGDGLADIVAQHRGANENVMSVLLQDGSGRLKAPLNYSFISGAPAIADVNGDGRNDLVASWWDTLTVYLQAPNGAFFPPVHYAFDIGTPDDDYMAFGDVNGDGLMDVVAFGTKSGILVLYGDRTQEGATTSVQVTASSNPGSPGKGSVASDPPGISCGAGQVCNATFKVGSRVVLTALPASDSVFDGWSWPCETDTKGRCAFVVPFSPVTITADFSSKSVKVAVKKVAVNGGKGTVMSDLGGINCGSACEADYPTGRTFLTLKAIPAPGFRFHGWGKGCNPDPDPKICRIYLAQPVTTTATFGPPGMSVTVVAGETGTGTVKSSPQGIDCTGHGKDSVTCFAGFAAGTDVTLTAYPAIGTTIRQWEVTGGSGACRGWNSCTLKTDNDFTSVKAVFSREGFLFGVNKSGSGTGNVKSNRNYINCGAMCYFLYQGNFFPITLVATPDRDSVFTGWTGCDDVSGNTCTVRLAGGADRFVTADFRIHSLLTVTKSGPGYIVSSPAGIQCGSVCSARFAPNASVTLTATPDVRYGFASWSGACSGTSSTCTVAMARDASVTALFYPLNQGRKLTVARQNGTNGNGIVTSSDGFIDCGEKGGACTRMCYPNAPVTLSATASADSVFTGWSGACTASSGKCSLTMNKAKSVTAHFVGPQKLTVLKQSVKKGSGTVISSPAGIACGTSCSSAYAFIPLHQSVTLTATPDPGSTVTAWKPKSLKCSGPTCTVTMDKSLTVTVTFTKGTVTGKAFIDDGEEER